MFNLGTLLQVSALTMGVASATPIRNAEENHVLTTKNETITNDYMLTFEITNQTTESFNEWETYQYTDIEKKINYQVNSPYINVLASQYETKAQYTINDTNCFGFANNYYTQNQSNKDFYQKATRTTFVIQITPYNYNLDTELSIVLSNNIKVLIDEYNYSTTVQNKILNRNIYQTTQDNWSQYLNKQIVKFQGNVIINDIENVNNNFYYTKETSKINWPFIPEMATANYYDEIEISITPKKTNYIVIDYVVSVDAVEYDPFNNTTTTITTELIPIASEYYTTDNPIISGTNVIPDGSYEVIDIPDLMWEILTMPFAFVSQAFNLTLFPGTPYQINISNLFLSIIAIIVFIWLITFFLKLKG